VPLLNVSALGFFSNADVETRQGSAPDQMIVDVNVTEKPTGSFTFGGNYSVSDGANLIASFSEANFLGRGQSLSFSLTTDIDDGSLSFNFVEPAFLGRDVAFGFSAGLGTSQPGYAEYNIERAYVSPRLTFPVSEHGSLTLNYRAEMARITDDDDYSDGDVTYYAQQIQDDIAADWETTSSVGYSYSYDTRRSGLSSNSGILFKFGQDFAGPVGGDISYTKTSFELTGRTKVWNEEITLMATLEGGILDAGDDSSVANRYFNSSSIIRGFETGGIGPRSTDNDAALGGNYYAVARLDAQFPLGLHEEYGLSGGLFFDYGSVWGLDDTDGIYSGSEDLHWRSVIGASVFWTTPLGPLRFNFSKALQKEDYDEEQTFDLTISTSF